MLVFDDIHWGEPTFLDLVDRLADTLSDVPVLVVCIARPELLDVRPGWGGGKLNATSVLLEPLSDQESETLLDTLTGSAELDGSARQRIVDAAGGNPLFVEELLALVQEGATGSDSSRFLRPSRRCWRLAWSGCRMTSGSRSRRRPWRANCSTRRRSRS